MDKMDQLMAEMDEMRNQQNALIMEDQPNTAITGIQRNPIQTSPVETPSNADTSADQFHLPDSAVENQGENNEDIEADVAVATASSAGLVKTNSGRGNINEPKVSNQLMSDDFNFPISQEELIMLQSKSSSTLNFSVHLLRELFTLEELKGKNISGSRGKDKVDPTRVEMIKEIVFKVDGTKPPRKEMVWRSCRQAMDAYIRTMKREKGFKHPKVNNQHMSDDSNFPISREKLNHYAAIQIQLYNELLRAFVARLKISLESLTSLIFRRFGPVGYIQVLCKHCGPACFP